MTDRIQAFLGDSREVLKTLPAASVDSVVCDPPYALTSTTKRWSNSERTDGTMPKVPVYARATAGFMGQKWDNGETAFDPEFWREVFRVLKPGAHVVAFSGTRTYHRMACAIEDAGFEIRDQIGWIFGSGFPKSHDVSKGIDRAAGAEREKVAVGAPVKRMIPGADQNGDGSWIKDSGREYQPGVEIPASDTAREWQGWGTALKPAWEPICLARKPLIGTVVANVLEHGTGAINIGDCRILTEENLNGGAYAEVGGRQVSQSLHTGSGMNVSGKTVERPVGRWPANIITDGSEEVLAAFPDTEPSTIGKPRGAAHGDGWGMTATGAEYDDSGSAARFFYSAKADQDDRLGSKHPTVKPVDLMQYLVRLVTPKGGLVLDPFAGTGTTGEAAFREGCRAVLIEREDAFYADIQRRIALLESGPGARRNASIKASGKTTDAGPLFGERMSKP